MQAPGTCSFLDQLCSCDSPMETDFLSILESQSALPSLGLTPWHLRDWSPFNRVSDPKNDSKTNPFNWGSLELSPLVHAFLPDQMEETELDWMEETEEMEETETETEQSTLESLNSSFDMTTLTSFMSITNHSKPHPKEHSRFHSTFQSMMESQQDQDLALEQHQESKTTQKSGLISQSTMSNLDLLFGSSSLGLSENSTHHSKDLKSPWSFSQCPSKLWDPSKAQSKLWNTPKGQSKLWDTPKSDSQFWEPF